MSKLRFVLLQVVEPRVSQQEAFENMKELEQLVETFGGEVVEKSLQHRHDPNPATYIGGGKIEWLSRVVQEEKIDVVVLNDLLRSGQLFRLEENLWPVNRHIQVWDRVGLILNIFDQHAKTAEAKMQIELARITYIGPRIYGLGGTVLSKQGAGIGTRGAGETNIELERRQIKRRSQQIEKQLNTRATLAQNRITDRQRRGVKSVALVGYTSAGKTTLFNTLTGKEKQMHSGLFTTLDSVVGKIKVPSIHEDVLVSDTIGFIRDLPPLLIKAFRSTLMESVQADVILHVVDVGDPKMQEKIDVVNTILADLEITKTPILVFSKTDKVSPERLEEVRLQFAENETVFVSATTENGIDTLLATIRDQLL